MEATRQALRALPARLSAAVQAFARGRRLEEIRVRQALPLSVTTELGNTMLDERGRPCPASRALRADAAEVRETLFSLCEGSVYRHVDTLSRGFLVTVHGVRAGICSQSVESARGRRLSLSDVVAINLRIPHRVSGAADGVLEEYRRAGVCSTLVYSRPGAGKTTLLRDLALRLSAGEVGDALRLSVVDERGELFPKHSALTQSAGLLDVLSGVEKREGISLSTRLLSPQMIVCDELSEREEEAVLRAVGHTGVMFCASVHAASLEELYARKATASLLRAGVFSLFCGIEQDAHGRRRVRLARA